jgi:quercetin dioxygenase-like cupin family protein
MSAGSTPSGAADGGRDAPPRNEPPSGPTAEVIDLGAATALVEREAHRLSEQRAARSLFQSSTLGAVLTAVRAGGSVHNGQPDEATIIQGIRGECLISLDGHGAVIEPGTIVGIPRGMAWRLLARTDSVVLLTVASGNGPAS